MKDESSNVREVNDESASAAGAPKPSAARRRYDRCILAVEALVIADRGCATPSDFDPKRASRSRCRGPLSMPGRQVHDGCQPVFPT
jgi:hypothetical protein